MNNIKNYTKSVKLKSVQLTALIAVLITAFLLTSCSSIQTMLVNDTPLEKSAPAAPSYSPKPGGELFIAIPEDIRSYDPLLAQNGDLINMLSLVYETPLTVAADGRIQPNLVETWQNDDTGTEFTFSFRRGIVFHNGEAMTAKDVYETIMDILALDGTNGTTSSPGSQTSAKPDEQTSDGPGADESPDSSAAQSGAGFISSWTSGGGNAQSTETADTESNTGKTSASESGTAQATEQKASRYTIYNKEIDSVTLVDENTIKLKMKKPGRDALYFMTFPVRPQGESDFGKPVGTGPYAVEDMKDAVTLKVNGIWWKKAPYIQTIIAKPAGAHDNKMENYESGLLDFVTTSNISANKLKTEGKTQTVDYLTNYYDCLIPNLFDGKMKNDDVRRAISYAIDRRDIIANVLLNHAVAAEMPISSSFFAFNNKFNRYELDKNMSKQLLAKAGYTFKGDESGSSGMGSPLNVSIIVPKIIGQEYRVEAARTIAKQLGDVGINCTVDELTLEEYSKRLKEGNFTLAYTSYYLDQNMDLTFMFDPNSESNFGHIASSELMGYIDACNKAIGETDIIGAYEELEQYFMDKVPQIGLYFRMHTIITDANVKGISKPYENHIFSDISAWSLEQNH